MFLFHWFCSVLATLRFCFCSVLAYLPLWQMEARQMEAELEAELEAKLLFIGFDQATKDALIQRLIHQQIIQHQPTQYPSHMELSCELNAGKIKFKAFDVVSSQVLRLVRDYYAKVDVIVYFFDTTDVNRFGRIEKLLELYNPRICDLLTNVPFLIFRNINGRIVLSSLRSLSVYYRKRQHRILMDSRSRIMYNFLIELGTHDFLVEVRRHNFLIEAFLLSVAQNMTEDA